MPALTDTIEPTLELDGDATSELPGPENLPDAGETPEHGVTVAAGVTIGSVLGERYVLEDPLGDGGTAVVSRALDLGCSCSGGGDVYVAIKTLRPELRSRPHSIARLRREFRQTQTLDHPNVVRHYDIGCDQGTWFIAMELLDGVPLGERLRVASPLGLPAAEALRIAAACGDALAFAHGRGVTHGDMKPDNVFVTAADGVRVLDFGVAPDPVPPLLNTPPPEQVAPAATRAYASPEVLSGQYPEPRDDVFSLACVIYEMLAGNHPYGRRSAEEARDAGLAVVPLPGMTSAQWRALAAGLAWNRDARPSDVRVLLRSLGADTPAATPRQVFPAPALAVTAAVHAPSSRARLGALEFGVMAMLGILLALAGPESRSGPQPGAHGASYLAILAAAAESRRDVAPGDGDDIATSPDPGTAAAAAPRRARAITPPRRVSFGSTTMTVSRATVAAAIPLHLDPGGRRVQVAWRTIYVPIVNDLDAGGERTFTVALTGSHSGASLGPPQRIVVTIAEDG